MTTTPTQVQNYRPICLFSTIYDLVTKVLTNRIKPIIDALVNPAQSAFIESGDIIANILFSHDY